MAVGFVGAGEFFEEVGVLDGGSDFVVAGGPFAEVDAAAAVGAEGEVFIPGKDDGAAGGAAEGLDLRGGGLRHMQSILILSSETFNTFPVGDIAGGAVTMSVVRLTSREALYGQDGELLEDDGCSGESGFRAGV